MLNLDSTLAYAVNTYSKNDGEYNTAIGNMMADAVYEESNALFKSRTGENIRFCLTKPWRHKSHNFQG